MEFSAFKVAVAKQFQRMQQHPMFRVDIDRDTLWTTYLASFPPGTNPIFRQRTEYDCGCCKGFIRAIGDVVAVIDGRVVSLWEVETGEPGYNVVAAALARTVLDRPIKEPFLHYEAHAGTDKNFEQLTDRTFTWNHFHVNIRPGFVERKDVIPTTLSTQRSTYDVLERSLREITNDALDAVVDLIRQGSLYRGVEHLHAVEKFRDLQREYEAPGHPDGSENGRRAHIWMLALRESQSVSRIRNTAIGTLLTDLSEGKDLDAAVASFEAKVAPTNYKRPTALVTKAMIEKAKQKVEELGLTSALERRYARLPDITINNILFADRTAKRTLTGGVFDDLAAQVSERVKTMDGIEEVPIERFLAEVLPRADGLEVMLENRHAGNLVSLIAPVDPTAGQLFKWDNGFSWSYAGELADSIKERVKQAGGNVTGDLCCRLAWFNYDDLDLHMQGPGHHIYFAQRQCRYAHSMELMGALDVDMNAGAGRTREPVENIFYPSRRLMPEGNYRLLVNQFNRRESDKVGFEVEMDYLGDVTRFAYAMPMNTGATVEVASFSYSHVGGLKMISSLPSSQATRTVWGLPTQSFHRCHVMMASPNYWDGAGVGNKHFFFMLDGCANDGTARGFFNEFLRSNLDPHRKVFEMVGSKMKPAPATEQLSGLGFSSTKKDTLVCRVKGSFNRTIKVVF